MFKLETCSQNFGFGILMAFTVITGNVKKKVREKKPSCRKERRAWNKASFEYNRIQRIERKLPASCNCLTNKLIYRVRDLFLSALPKFNQEEPVEVRLKLVTTKGHQRRRARLQSLRAMVIKSGKVCNNFYLIILFVHVWGNSYVGPVLLCRFLFFHFLSNLYGTELDTDSCLRVLCQLR